MTHHTAEGTASLRRQARRALVAATFLCLVGSAAADMDFKTIDVDISPGHTKETNVGCGFELITKPTLLEVNLYWPIPTPVDDSECDEKAPNLQGHVWVKVDKNVWRCLGIEPYEEFWAVLWGVKGGGGGGGGPSKRWMSVSDCDLDADTDNNSEGWPRVPDETDDEDKIEYYDTPYATSTVPGIALGANDDHDEFLPDADPWGRDLDNDTADLDKEGTNYDGHSVGLAKLQLTVNAKRDGQLDFDFSDTIVRLFESDGSAFQGARNLGRGKHELTFWMECIEEDNYSPAVTVTFDPVGSPGVAQDAITVTPVKMDIDVDSDNNGTIVDDNSQAEDLNEAKPDEPGMVVSLTEDPEEPPEGDPNGVLRGLYSGTISDVLDLHNPVVTLKKVSGEGNVQVWKVRDGQDPVLMLDTSEEESTTTDGEGNSLWDLLADCSDHDVIITGVEAGEVQLGLELTVNGAKVSMDVVHIATMDLDVDSDNDNGFEMPERDDEEEYIEMDAPGKLVMLNANDDNENDVEDRLESDPVVGEVDLYPMVLKVFSADGAGKWKLKVSSGADKVKFYLGSDRSNPLPLTGGETEERNIPTGLTLITVYVEGSALSAASGDVTVELWTDPDGSGSGPFSKQDDVKMTVWWMDITRILDKDGQAYTDPLVIGENYRFEYTLQPAGIALPKALFKIAFTNAGGNEVEVHKEERQNIAAGTDTILWQETKWTVANAGCYANPKNGTYSAYWAVENTHRCSNKKDFTTQLILEADLKDDKPSSDEISSGIYKDSSYAMRIGVQCDGQAAIMGTSPQFSGEDQQNLDNDTDDGPEIRKVHIKQAMPHVDPGDYKVVIKDLRDVAGNLGPGGEDGVIDDWIIRLR